MAVIKYLTGRWRISALIATAVAAIFIAWLLLAVPRPLFPDTWATLLETADGELLGARIAPDGQWRFPAPDSVPYRFEKSLLMFEDRYFYYHPGINPGSMARAFIQNISAGKRVSGGSTITMQVARLSGAGKPRTIANKTIETLRAIYIELRFSKKEILQMYAAHAPFGGNVVGIEAASWRYYNQPPHRLSWGEAATLAVLPNAPSLIFPGKNDSLLLAKRNRLLNKLLAAKVIDTLTCNLAMQEPLPARVFQLPDKAYHLLEYAIRNNQDKRIKTTLDPHLQEQVSSALARHARQLAGNNIHNAAALVANVNTHKVLAYVGNVPRTTNEEQGQHVDLIRSPRSSGSILKPFLYAAMSDRGMLAPNQLIDDIPVRFGGFTPLNFSRNYDGAVRAEEALARSLNIPAVKLLQKFGVAPFHHFLQNAGMSTLTRTPDHYGLSLILGGAEATLWDLAGMYASLARTVVNFEQKDGFYPLDQFQPLTWTAGETYQDVETSQPLLRASAAWLTLKAMQQVVRPDEETGWEAFAESHHIAWKTGTSFGFRDGWAIGTTTDYVVAVWTGNASGEGRPGLTGTLTAAPLMFDIFRYLPASRNFAPPTDELVAAAFCRQSGYLPSPHCTETDTLIVPSGVQIGICPWHKTVHLDKNGDYRVTADCYPVMDMQQKSWFILPPLQEFYYKRRNPGYTPLPPFRDGCSEMTTQMEWLYPREVSRVFIPRQLDGTPGEAIFEIAHRDYDAEIYWFLNQSYIGSTQYNHQMNINPPPGWHTMTVTDQHGNQLKKTFLAVQTEN